MVVLPLSDDDPLDRGTTPVVTYGLLILNIVIFLAELGLTPEKDTSFVLAAGLIPATVTGVTSPIGLFPVELTFVTYMFLHGGWFHLIGNMLFLWVFGDNIEEATGHAKFLVFYLLCGIVAAATQTFVSPHSIVPMIGASGAISGVLGAYLLLYPRVRVHTLIILPIYITTVALPAWVMLGYWALIQLVSGLGSLSEIDKGGVAFFAHVGGFIAGLVLIRLFASEEVLRRRPTQPESYYRYRSD